MFTSAFKLVNKIVKNKCILKRKNIRKSLSYNAILCMQLGETGICKKKPEEPKSKSIGLVRVQASASIKTKLGAFFMPITPVFSS